jgi:hypothetical protein
VPGDGHNGPVTVDEPELAQARAVIRSFWLRDVKELRDRYDRERRERNLEPVQNKEISAATGIPRTTLSDWLTCKRDTVASWDRVGLIIEYLGGTSKEWVPKWRAARAAYDSLEKSAQPPEETVVGRMPARSSKRWWIGAVVAAGVVAVGAVTWVVVFTSSSGSAPSGSDMRPAAGDTGTRCLQVRDDTVNVSVFKDPHGYSTWTEWPGRTRFRGEVDADNPNRYRVRLANGQYGYVNRDGRYVITAKDCS